MSDISAGDWFACGQIFSKPFCFDDPDGQTESAKKFGVSIGIQVLCVMDVASSYALAAEPLKKTPSALTSAEVIKVMLGVMQKHGMPRIGWVVSESVWQSSLELLANGETEDRAKYLDEIDVQFGAMATAARDEIRDRLLRLGLKCVFGQREFEQIS